jgi:hypothetical protein
MGRKSVEVDRNILSKIIEELEQNEKFENQSKLYTRVAEEYTKKTGTAITSSVIYLRIKKFGIVIKTEKAKLDPSRFRERLSNTVSTGEDCIKPKAKQTVAQLLEFADEKEKKKWEKLAKSVLRGSRKAAIKFNCISCANFQTTEVKNCEINTCPFYLFRPYQ